MLSVKEPQSTMVRSAPGPAGANLQDGRDRADFASVLAGGARRDTIGAASDDVADTAAEAGSGPEAEGDPRTDRMQADVAAVAAPPASAHAITEDAGGEGTRRRETAGSLTPPKHTDWPAPVLAGDGPTTARDAPLAVPDLAGAGSVIARDTADSVSGLAEARHPGLVTMESGAAPDPSPPVIAAIGGAPASPPNGAAPGRMDAESPPVAARPSGPSPTAEGKPVAEVRRPARHDGSVQAGEAVARPQAGDAGVVVGSGLLRAGLRLGTSADRSERVPEATSRPGGLLGKVGTPVFVTAADPGAVTATALHRIAGGAPFSELARRTAEGRMDPLSALPLGTEARAEMPGSAAMSLSGASAGPLADLSFPVVRQVAVTLAQATAQGRNSIELRLNPEELGTVRLRLESVGDALSVSVQAERDETLDLMRRNIDLLSQQLRDIGYDTARFVFSQGGSTPDNAFAPRPATMTGASSISPQEGPASPLPVLVLGDRLDIRL